MKRLYVAAALGAFFACSGDPVGPRMLSHVEVVSGEGQSAAPGEALPQPIVARALGDDGGQFGTLWIRIAEGNGRITIGGGTAVGNGAAVGTSADPVEVTWTLGEEGGPQELLLFATAPIFPGDTVFATVTATALGAGR